MSEDFTPEQVPPPVPRLTELPAEIDPFVKLRTTGFLGQRLRYLPSNEQHITTDPLTNLPIYYRGAARKIIMQEYYRYIANPQEGSVMLIYSDLDQLKRVNDAESKEVGNHYIRWGAASITNGINDILIRRGHVSYASGAQMVAMRATGAADETITWLFGLDPETEAEIKAFLDTYSDGTDVTLNGKDGPQKFNASSSLGYVSSSDP